MELTCESIINLEFWAFGHGEDETVFGLCKVFKRNSSRISVHHCISKCVGERPLTLLKSRKLAFHSSWYNIKSGIFVN